MKSAELRQAFLKFFEDRGHKVVSSSPLVPADDPTLLFTNAGMVQFKDLFLGKEKRSYSAAVTAQKVVRAGGKHNDLENVGYTARHHTFFEMLGNFSFGDYFKPEAIGYAWTFVTEVLGLAKERLWVTVFESDDESYALWRDQIGVPEARIIRLGEDSNFWAMGDTGPCGPCSEIFYDHGPDVPGGPPGSPDEDGDRYVEIWNLVFMQFERSPDGTLVPLPAPSVDTGMGLERVSAVMQSVHSNYDIDIFKALIEGIAERLGVKDKAAQSLKVLADHLRSGAFLIADGVLPSNEGRGYVLRRIIRRALRHGRKLGAEGLFFAECLPLLVQQMGQSYPELVAQQAHITRVLTIEEEKFGQTLEQGMKHLEQAFSQCEGAELPGEVAFTLYDTYGFPLDLTADVARERGVSVDVAGFDEAMSAQRERSRETEQFNSEGYARIAVDQDTEFLGYESLHAQAKLLLVTDAKGEAGVLAAGQSGILVLDRSPFYAESGGQVGDCGTISGQDWVFRVTHTTKNGGIFLHHGTLEGSSLSLPLHSLVTCQVSPEVRAAVMRNHSATHLMHAALREIVGTQVEQKGSLVTADRLRFDFSSFEAVTKEQLAAIELRVNTQILANLPVDTALMSIEDAKQAGAMALFGEKYGEEVRVLSMGEPGFSVELCGGTHVQRTGDIGMLRIVSEGGIAAGVRRIEAVTGLGALAWGQASDAVLGQCSALLNCAQDALVPKLRQLQSVLRQQEKELDRLKTKLASGVGADIAQQAVDFGSIRLLVVALSEPMDAKGLRALADQTCQRLGRAVVVLATVEEGKVQLVTRVAETLQSICHAGELASHIAQQVDGRGGGKAHMAMAGGQSPEKLKAALASVEPWLKAQGL